LNAAAAPVGRRERPVRRSGSGGGSVWGSPTGEAPRVNEETAGRAGS
jgi:hypothetical protein